MQRQADLLGIPVVCSAAAEATARGVAALAAISSGLLSEGVARQLIPIATRYEPQISSDEREGEYAAWRTWLEQARTIM